MFKFLKSKKGFTLVELMIVVVIMAILVAVAVPIYSAVTANSRKKTCIANMREIVGQLNTAAMSDSTSVKAGTITITTNDAADDATVSEETGITTANFSSLFQKVPYCPVANAVIEVTTTIGSGDNAGQVTITIECDQEGHVL